MNPLERLRDAVTRTRELTHDRPPTGRTHDDADGTIGTLATDSAVDFDPFPLLEALHEAGARAMAIGQPHPHPNGCTPQGALTTPNLNETEA
jgi:hypothetical protein